MGSFSESLSHCFKVVSEWRNTELTCDEQFKFQKFISSKFETKTFSNAHKLCSSVWQRKRWLEFGMARPLNGGDKILSRESQRTKFRCLSLLHLAARSIKARRMILIDLWPQPIETTITICQPGRLQMVRVKLRFRHHRRRTNKFIVLQSASCGDVGP